MVNSPLTASGTKNETYFEEYSNDNKEDQVISDIKDSVNENEILIDQKNAYENILNAKVDLQLNEKVVAGLVKQQALET